MLPDATLHSMQVLSRKCQLIKDHHFRNETQVQLTKLKANFECYGYCIGPSMLVAWEQKPTLKNAVITNDSIQKGCAFTEQKPLHSYL